MTQYEQEMQTTQLEELLHAELLLNAIPCIMCNTCADRFQ